MSLSQPDAEHTYLALALAWPLFAIFLLLVPERGIANRWGFLYTLSAGVLVLAAPRLLDLVMALLSEHPDWFKTWPTDAIVLPWFACGLYALAFLFGLFQSWRLGDETEVAIVATLAASFVVLGYFNLAYVSLSLFAAAGLVQAVSLLRSSHAMAYRDELTNLLGRRALNERLKGLGPRYSIAMLDIDHFKKFNDTYGHDTGDEVLKLVASRLARVGAGGTAYRYGGEEFSVVFPRKGIEQCTDALDGLRDAGVNTGGPATLGQKDRQAFANQLDRFLAKH